MQLNVIRADWFNIEINKPVPHQTLQITQQRLFQSSFNWVYWTRVSVFILGRNLFSFWCLFDAVSQLDLRVFMLQVSRYKVNINKMMLRAKSHGI